MGAGAGRNSANSRDSIENSPCLAGLDLPDIERSEMECHYQWAVSPPPRSAIATTHREESRAYVTADGQFQERETTLRRRAGKGWSGAGVSMPACRALVSSRSMRHSDWAAAIVARTVTACGRIDRPRLRAGVSGKIAIAIFTPILIYLDIRKSSYRQIRL